MVGFNAADYLIDRQVRDGNGDRIAVVTPGRTLTYGELAAEVHRMSGGLAGIGVRPEERVMLCMVDGVELLTGILGAMRLGAVPVPVSTMLTGPELGKVLVDSRARVLCVSDEFSAAAKAAIELAPEVTDVVLDRADPIHFSARVRTHYWTELSTSKPLSAYHTWEDSPALWLYTSGTTGEPKGAIHRHANIRAVCETYGSHVLGIGRDDRCFSVAKLFFAYGIGNSAFFPLSVGASSILDPGRPSPRAVAETVRAGLPTLFFGVPTFYSALLASDIPDDTFSSVRQAVSAGEPLPAVIFERFRERFGVEILDGIGSTEALHIFMSNRPGRAVPGTTGVAVPGYDVEIRGTGGAPIEDAGRPGELYVRGPSTAVGYWSRYDTTKRIFQGEWLRTGDSYLRNADGTYTCLGRFNDMLKAGGIWVSPAEVERRLLRHPDVAEAAVVAAPDADGIDKPVACVVPVAGREIDEQALIEFCREGLASFKRPRAVVRVAELPKTATGKIRRNVIREFVRDSLRPGAIARSSHKPFTPGAHR